MSDQTVRYPNEVHPYLPERVLYVADIAAFAGPDLNWTIEGIAEILRFRAHLGNPIGPTTAEFVMVPCPQVSYAELNTEAFRATWAEFARQHVLNLNISIRTTFNTSFPNQPLHGDDMSRTEQLTLGTEGNLAGGFLCINFHTKEAYEVDGPRTFWGHLLGRDLRIETNDPDTVLETIPTDPERVFGEPGLVYHDGALNPFSEIVVIRYGKRRGLNRMGPVARAFRMEHR